MFLIAKEKKFFFSGPASYIKVVLSLYLHIVPQYFFVLYNLDIQEKYKS